MFKEVWCITPYWKRIFISILLLHGVYNILFFDDYLDLYNMGASGVRFFDDVWFYYFISYLPLLELGIGLLLVFGFRKKLMLGTIFYLLLLAGYYALDSNYLTGFLVFFALAFFSLFILFGQYHMHCREENKNTKVPTGGM
ncbi:hypothetical protein [Robertkochia flava]|uniref:hypothetical protein n=1 Tax=Robertkochia flava TaxID=3447986 RepID=UPI001CCAF9CC|nr:hypothetical protein [Robertkochia marina]